MFFPWILKFLGGQHFQISANSFPSHMRFDDVIYKSCKQADFYKVHLFVTKKDVDYLNVDTSEKLSAISFRNFEVYL